MSYKFKQKTAYRSLLNVMFKGEERVNAASASPLKANAKNRKKSFFSKLGTPVRLLLMAIPFGALLVLLGVQGYYMSKVAFITAEVVYKLAVFGVFMLNLLFGLFGVVSYLYYVKDITFYLSLPLTADQILKAKFLQYLTLSSLGSLLFVPLIASFNYFKGLSVLEIIAWVVCYLAAALCLDIVWAIVTIILIRFSKFARNQDRFIMVYSVLTIVFSLGFATVMQFVRAIDIDGFSHSVVELVGSFVVGLIMAILTPPLLLSKLLATGVVWQLVLAMALGILAVAAYYWLLGEVGKRYYFDGVLAIQMKTSGGGRELKADDIRKLSRGKSIFKSLAKADYIKYRRNPTFFTQAILTPLLMPILFIVIFGASIFAAASKDGLSFAAVKEKLMELRLIVHEFTLLDVIKETPIMAIAILGFLLTTMFFGVGGVQAARLAVSSDGEDFAFYRALPIKAETYLLAKSRLHILIGILPDFLLWLALGLVINLNPVVLIFALLIKLVIMLIFMGIGFNIGARHPVFNWDNEMRLYKGGKNALWVYLQFFIGLLIAAPLGVLAYFSLKDNPAIHLEFWQLTAIMLAYIALLAVICFVWFKKSAKHLWKRDC
ncbi:MAG: hypothetical protein Q4P65_01520 [Eubacteriales bacterium]|nr:hypothetical protein [Eubacteriales bacterium]